MAGAGLGIPDGGDGGGRQADGVGVAGGEPQAGAQRVTGRSKPEYRSSQESVGCSGRGRRGSRSNGS